MDAELRQVANGFDYKVRSFDKYDINGYRFRTYGKELSMADRKSTNCCVSAIGEGGTEYYGRVEAIYELLFYGENPPNVVDTSILHHAFISIFIALWAVITHYVTILMPILSYFTRFT